MFALVQSESSFGAYVCHGGLRGSTATAILLLLLMLPQHCCYCNMPTMACGVVVLILLSSFKRVAGSFCKCDDFFFLFWSFFARSEYNLVLSESQEISEISENTPKNNWLWSASGMLHMTVHMRLIFVLAHTHMHSCVYGHHFCNCCLVSAVGKLRTNFENAFLTSLVDFASELCIQYTVKVQIFVRYPFLYFWVETGRTNKFSYCWGPQKKMTLKFEGLKTKRNFHTELNLVLFSKVRKYENK